MTVQWPKYCACGLTAYLERKYGVPLAAGLADADFAYLYHESQRFCQGPVAYADSLRALATRRSRDSGFPTALDAVFAALAGALSAGTHAPHEVAEALQIAAHDLLLIDEIRAYNAPETVVAALTERLAAGTLYTAGRLLKNACESLHARSSTRQGVIDPSQVRRLKEVVSTERYTWSHGNPIDPEEPVLVVATAGRGTRLRSTIPKALIPLDGKPLLRSILQSAVQAGIHQTILILKYGAELHPPVFGAETTYVTQNEALGTGHSFASALSALQGHRAPCVLSYSDTPFLNAACFRGVLEPVRLGTADMTILTAPAAEMPEFGRVFEAGDQAYGIGQPRFGDPPSPRADAGLYALHPATAWPALLNTSNHNHRYEFSFTGIVSELHTAGRINRTVPVTDTREAVGINRPAELIAARRLVAELRAALDFYREYGGPNARDLPVGELLSTVNHHNAAIEAGVGNTFTLESVPRA